MQHTLLDFFINSIYMLKMPLLAVLSVVFSLEYSHIPSKFKPLKLSIFSTKSGLKNSLLFSSLAWLTGPLLFGGIDLEKNPQNFFLDFIKIELTDYPDAFNPSIVKWKEDVYICFRDIKDDQSLIGIVRLDENFQPIQAPQILNEQIESNGLEDARLVVVNDELYLIYSACPKDLPIIEHGASGGNCRMYIAKCRYQEDGVCFIESNECITYFEWENPKRREKNWVPFDYEGQLMLAYSINPHLIVQPLFGQQSCEAISYTTHESEWQWGELRGGTPAIRVGANYLSFFHSSIEMASDQSAEQTMLHYFIGAYLYSGHPPFNIISYSPTPIIWQGCYSGKQYEPYWHPVKVVFPCGIMESDNAFWISYGQQDHEMRLVKIHKQKLIDSLKTPWE